MAKTRKPFDCGKKLFSWTAHDYHPHERGVLWHIIFCAAFFGGSIWAVLADPRWGWVTAFCFCTVAGIYLITHRGGNQDHEVQIFEKGLLIDERCFVHWDKVLKYWFVYDESVAVINFDLKKESNQPIKLQMGDITLDKFREVLTAIPIEEDESKEESVIDLWIRVLKL